MFARSGLLPYTADEGFRQRSVATYRSKETYKSESSAPLRGEMPYVHRDCQRPGFGFLFVVRIVAGQSSFSFEIAVTSIFDRLANASQGYC